GGGGARGTAASPEHPFAVGKIRLMLGQGGGVDLLRARRPQGRRCAQQQEPDQGKQASATCHDPPWTWSRSGSAHRTRGRAGGRVPADGPSRAAGRDTLRSAPAQRKMLRG